MSPKALSLIRTRDQKRLFRFQKFGNKRSFFGEKMWGVRKLCWKKVQFFAFLQFFRLHMRVFGGSFAAFLNLCRKGRRRGSSYVYQRQRWSVPSCIAIRCQKTSNALIFFRLKNLKKSTDWHRFLFFTALLVWSLKCFLYSSFLRETFALVLFPLPHSRNLST